jgi:hypothetical protein
MSEDSSDISAAQTRCQDVHHIDHCGLHRTLFTVPSGYPQLITAQRTMCSHVREPWRGNFAVYMAMVRQMSRKSALILNEIVNAFLTLLAVTKW